MNVFKIIYPELAAIENLELALADNDDAEFIALLSKHFVEFGMSGWTWNPDRVVSQIKNPDALVIVGRSDDRVIAAGIVEYGEYEAHLNLLAVEPLFQRSGIGSCLVRFIEHTALLAGNSKVHLEVRFSNLEARAFYRALGYQEIRIKRNYYKGNEAAIHMTRYIQPHSTDQIMKDQTSE